MPIIYNRTRDLTVKAIKRIKNSNNKKLANRRKLVVECLAEKIGETAIKCWFMLKQDKSVMPIGR